MQTQIPLDEFALADEQIVHGVHEVAPDVAYQRVLVANVVYCGLPGAGDRRWILIDAGAPGLAGRIRRTANERFGHGARPYAIVLTHGHTDHVGTLLTLAREWDAPVFAHISEVPFLNGSMKYPPPDPFAGGMMSLMSPLLSRGPIDIGERLYALPRDQSIPGMPGWMWVHTPGHTPGHVSLWRPQDRMLIAGDAFITTRQESAYAALISQRPEMHGPPQYFTPDWQAAKQSVRELARLEPETVITGHGFGMQGAAMRQALHELAQNFDEIAVPESHKRRAAREAVTSDR